MHFTSAMFRIPQMLPVPSCSHTGKSLNNDVNLSFMVTLLLQILKELCNVVLFFFFYMFECSKRKYCGTLCNQELWFSPHKMSEEG